MAHRRTSKRIYRGIWNGGFPVHVYFHMIAKFARTSRTRIFGMHREHIQTTATFRREILTPVPRRCVSRKRIAQGLTDDAIAVLGQIAA